MRRLRHNTPQLHCLALFHNVEGLRLAFFIPQIYSCLVRRVSPVTLYLLFELTNAYAAKAACCWRAQNLFGSSSLSSRVPNILVVHRLHPGHKIFAHTRNRGRCSRQRSLRGAIMVFARVCGATAFTRPTSFKYVCV